MAFSVHAHILITIKINKLNNNNNKEKTVSIERVKNIRITKL